MFRSILLAIALFALLVALGAGCGKKTVPEATAPVPHAATTPGVPETPAAPAKPAGPAAGKTMGPAPAFERASNR